MKIWHSFALGLSGITLLLTVSPLAIAGEEILRIGVKENLRPLAFRDKTGQLQGLEIDLAQKIAQALQRKPTQFELIPLQNQDRLPALWQNKVDIVIARMTATPNRLRVVDFSPHYYLDGTGIIIKASLSQEPKNLSQAKIAVLEHSDTIAVVRAQWPTARLVDVASYQAAYELLNTGQVDAFAADNSLLAGWAQEDPEFHHLPLRLSGEPLAVAMPKGLQYENLRQQVKAAIAELWESGWLAERADYWGLPRL